MRRELQDKLFADFPLIFPPEMRKDMQVSCMFWGVACGDGWYSLIRECCEHLQTRINHDPNLWPQVVAAQIKEKFGTLCFYIESRRAPSSEDWPLFAQTEIINSYERMSGCTCERCGTTSVDAGVTTRSGGVASPGWIRTLCENCRNTRYPREEDCES